ncbi:protein FAM200C-like [Arctopsyche grandis]|uniref:protein FAM200C-like n=1 Tax=Arctopsyche grandis TaxID=121162 RepID=UPI00406D69D9
MKPSRLNEHFLKKHPDKNNKDIFRNEKGLMVSYEIAQIIAKCGAPHTYGEKLILPAIRVFINNMIGQNQQEFLSSVPLSNDTVSKRIDEVANDIEIQLCEELQSKEFSLQLDESTLRDNESLLLAYVRFVKNEEIIEEMLFSKLLNTDTKAMVGRHRGFILRLKNVAPNVLTIHCIIYRQHLVAKKLNGRLHKSLSIFIVVINKIKSHPLNDRLFRQLCKENDEEFERLNLHTEVRWLSKGNCLKRFYALFDTIVEFLDVNNEKICIELKLLRNDVAYLSDIFGKINENLLKLQGSNISLIKAKGIILSFINKLKLFKNKLRRHIDALIEDMIIRFKDLYELLKPDWIINPFLSDVESVSQKLKEQFIELQNDCEAKICSIQSIGVAYVQSIMAS